EQFAFSVSATTRDPRPGEVDGEHYFFMTKNKFSSLAKSGGMIEWAQFCGNFYGTPREAVEKNLKEGKNVVLEIEVQGAAQVMAQYPDCVSIFILPPSIEELEARLRGRKTESDDVIKKRISASHDEIKFSLKYRHLVINDEVDRAADEVLDIIRREREIKENKNTLVGRVLNNG
ncbi:MAG: guanylate kinase, partial [Clostridia bacterium]|nr:guanylate kinase [Clostridia bacterium]